MKFNFDKLANLAQQDPAAFERYRKQILEEMIKEAHPTTHTLLKNLQTEIDAERGKPDKPIDFLHWLSHLLEDQITKNYLPTANSINDSENPTNSKKLLGKILPFTKRAKQ